jgi:hypothetical protein
MLLIVVLGLFSSCTTVTYPNGTTVTTPYVAPAYAPIYGAPGYPVPVAPYSPPGTPGAYYGYIGGCAPLVGLGIGWGNWGRSWGWGGGSCNGWNRSNFGCNSYNGYRVNCASGGYRYGH